MTRPTQYRVEHQPHDELSGRTLLLAVITDPKPNPRTLDPYLARLLREGKTGWATLVDEATGEVVIRRRIVWPMRA